MTLRRYSPLKPSRGTVIPHRLHFEVLRRDGFCCIGPRVGMAGDCYGPPEVDHVRASGALGKKSATELGNLVSLCSTHHRWKTEHGREARPLLLQYLAASALTQRERTP